MRQSSRLALAPPQAGSTDGHSWLSRHRYTPPTARPEVVLVWGGSSSVGCNAIQLAVASGYRCVATASARNVGLLKELGASEVLDHSSPAIVEDVIEAMRGRSLAGTLHATGHMKDCFAVVARCGGSRRVAATLAPPDERSFESRRRTSPGRASRMTRLVNDLPRILPQALAARTFVPALRRRSWARGLEMLQAALEALKAGVSAAKIVVTLPGVTSQAVFAFAV